MMTRKDKLKSVVLAVGAALFVVALALDGAGRLLGSAYPTPPGQQTSPLAEINQRLLALQGDLTQLKADRLAKDRESAGSVPTLVEATQRLAESARVLSAANDRSAELEAKLKALRQYANDVEASLAKLDVAISTPSVLQKKLDIQKANARP